METEARDLCRRARSHGLITPWDAAPDLGLLLAAGPRVRDFLNSQLTSDVMGLQPGQAQLSARLSRAGALVAAFSLHRLPERGQPFPSLVLLLPRDQIATLLADLAAYLFDEQILLEEVGPDFDGLVVQGPLSGELQPAADAADAVGTADPAVAFPPGTLWLQRSFTGDPGFVVLWPRQDRAQVPAAAELMQAAAAQAGLVALDTDETSLLAWDWLRVEAGWPLAGRDFDPGKRILPETGLEHQVVSTTKGCYLGQEVVARIRTYGSVPRALRGLVIGEPLDISVSDLPPAGRPVVTMEGAQVGTWASAAYSTVWERPVALAYLDRSHRTPGTRLALAAGDRELEAEVVLLPFYQGGDERSRAAGLYERAVGRYGAGGDREALSLLEDALRLDPSHLEAAEALGVILGRCGREHEAIDVLRRLEEAAPDEPMVNTNLSLLYMKIGDKDEAERQKALATLKKFGEGLSEQEVHARDQAERQARRREAERRRTMFQEVLAVDPHDALALMGLGNALSDLEDYAGAEACLAQARQVQKDNSPLYASHGKLLEKLGRPAEAAAVYRLGLQVASRKGDLMPLREMEHRLLLLGETADRS